MSSHQEVRVVINQRLVQSGEKEKLKEHLRSRLIECGWRDQIKLHAKEIIKSKGLEYVKLEDLVKEVTPRSRSLVPDSVKRELLGQIKDFLARQENI